MSNVPFAASNTRFLQVAPPQDLMRPIVSPFGAMTKTWPREACATKSRPFAFCDRVLISWHAFAQSRAPVAQVLRFSANTNTRHVSPSSPSSLRPVPLEDIRVQKDTENATESNYQAR